MTRWFQSRCRRRRVSSGCQRMRFTILLVISQLKWYSHRSSWLFVVQKNCPGSFLPAQLLIVVSFDRLGDKTACNSPATLSSATPVTTRLKLLSFLVNPGCYYILQLRNCRNLWSSIRWMKWLLPTSNSGFSSEFVSNATDEYNMEQLFICVQRRWAYFAISQK